MINEHKKGVKAVKYSLKTKNPVAKAHQSVGTGSGAHTDKKKTSSLPRKAKHKKAPELAESNWYEVRLQTMLEDAHQDGRDYPDHEIQMASSELLSIAKNASELLDLIRKYSEQKGLDAWQQSKITKAADYLNTVLQSINGEQQGVAEGTTPTPGLQPDGKYYNKAGRLIGTWDGRTLTIDPDTKQYWTDEFGEEEANDIAIKFQQNLQKAHAPSEDKIKYYANELEKSDLQANRPRKNRQQYYDLAVQMLSGQQGVAEEWSQKYKSSINCSHPKGFSQKAHCAGKKKHNESMMTMEMVCEDCGMCQTHGNLNEIKKGQKDANGFTRCWPGKHAVGTKTGKNGGQVRNCKPNENLSESNWYELRLQSLLESKLK
jgi:hypothetical protein